MEKIQPPIPAQNTGRAIKIGASDVRDAALATDKIIGIEDKPARHDLKKLQKSLLKTMNGITDNLPDNILTQDAKVIARVQQVIGCFNQCAGRTNFRPEPVPYHSGVSDDVVEMFCRAMPMNDSEPFHATLDSLLIHLSQIFKLHRKASFVYALGRSHPSLGILDQAMSHVAKQSVDYDKFERAIQTGKYILSKIAATPAGDVGSFLTEARMRGLDRSEVDQFIAKQTTPVINGDMGNLPESYVQSEATEETAARPEAQPARRTWQSNLEL